MSRSSASSKSEILRAHCAAIAKEEAALREGGGKAGHERQRKMGRRRVRERLSHLLDKDSPFFEIGLWAAYKMYEQWGKIPAAGVVTGIGSVQGIACMIIANDATVKAGAFFPQTSKKVIRAQRIAFECALPIIYLVDSAGVFLPMQDEISVTVDFFEKDDPSCLKRLRSLIALLPEAKESKTSKTQKETSRPAKSPETIYDLVSFDGQKNYDARDPLATIIDAGSMDEYKADYGKTLVTAHA